MDQKRHRPFQISCGLREGYATSNTVHTLDEARSVIQTWIEHRSQGGKKIVAGMLIEGQFIYPLIEGETISSAHEPAFHYQGVVREDASDTEAFELLEDLARTLAAELGQKRVHITFGSTYFTIEK